MYRLRITVPTESKEKCTGISQRFGWKITGLVVGKDENIPQLELTTSVGQEEGIKTAVEVLKTMDGVLLAAGVPTLNKEISLVVLSEWN